MMLRLVFLLLTMLAVFCSPSTAHEVRPAYLEIQESQPSTYDIFWKTPGQGAMRLGLNVVLPDGCQTVGGMETLPVRGAYIQRWRAFCDAPLPGRKIAIENLASSLTDVLLRFEPATGKPITLRIFASDPIAEIPERQTSWAVAGTYFHLGVEHILLGFDHLLFVLCLLFLVTKISRLLSVVTAFTLAHSITLAATTLGWIRLAPTPVEALIALSIAFLAAEIIRARSGEDGAIQRWPWAASFAFGLLHGFGFAGALGEIGLPDGAVPLALLTFNLGVEAGQLLFIVAALALMAIWRRFAPSMPDWAALTPAYAAGVLACFWFVERSAGIFF